MFKNFSTKICFLFVGISILLIGFILLILPAMREVRRIQNTVDCVNRMHGLACSIQDYQYFEDNLKIQTKLPFYGNNETCEEYWSWRASYITHFAPYNRTNLFRFSEFWNSEYNFPFFKKTNLAGIFSCPCDQQTDKASYVAVTGAGTFWTEMQNGNLSGEFYDYGDMILIIETIEPKNFWAQPGDNVTPEEVIRLFESDPGLVKNSKQDIKKSYTHWPKHYVTVIGDVKSFGSIKNIKELQERLTISSEQIENVKKIVKERKVSVPVQPISPDTEAPISEQDFGEKPAQESLDKTDENR